MASSMYIYPTLLMMDKIWNIEVLMQVADVKPDCNLELMFKKCPWASYMGLISFITSL